MRAEKVTETDEALPPEAAQTYIAQMLEEMSHIAQGSGLKNLAMLLRATLAASKVGLNTKD